MPTLTAHAGFSRFVGLSENDAPDLLTRMSRTDLAVDGQRYGVSSRLIAQQGVTVADLGAAVLKKVLETCNLKPSQLGAIVLSSRIVDVQLEAERVAAAVGADCPAFGIERACSGFPAATQVGLDLCDEINHPIAIIAAEIISPSINWEPAQGDLSDHRRARGQASKLFGDGTAAVVILPADQSPLFEILDAWSGELADDDQLIQKAAVENSVDPWGNIRSGAVDCMSMPGRRGLLLVRRAPQIMMNSLRESMQRAKSAGRIGSETLSDVVPHQANGLILSRLQEALSQAPATAAAKVWNCFSDSGNTVSASIPLAMSQAQDQLHPGDLIAMPAVGAGGPGYRPNVLSTGCVLVRAATTTTSISSPCASSALFRGN